MLSDCHSRSVNEVQVMAPYSSDLYVRQSDSKLLYRSSITVVLYNLLQVTWQMVSASVLRSFFVVPVA